MTKLGPFSIQRAEQAAEKVRQCLVRDARALDALGVPYAVAGDDAVARWVSRVDDSAVRATQDVDILIRRGDLPAIRVAMEAAGFTYRHAAGMDIFLDSPDARLREAVHIVFANEFVRPGEPAPNPDVSESERGDGFSVLSLAALVRIKLTAYRGKDRTHLRDMIDVGLIGRNTVAQLPPALGERLRRLSELFCRLQMATISLISHTSVLRFTMEAHHSNDLHYCRRCFAGLFVREWHSVPSHPIGDANAHP